MLMKRALLLSLGFAASVIVAAVLYISADAILIDGDSTLPTESTLPSEFTLPPEIDITQTQATAPKKMDLPIVVPNTTLIAQKLSYYEGPFLEDGSDREVVDVAALHVCNIGSSEVLQGYIELRRGENVLAFYAEHIPPGETILLLETNAKTIPQDGFTDCFGWQTTGQSANKAGELLSVTERAMGTIIVTNTTEQTINNICVYYKNWLSPPDIYVGGIVYVIEIPTLEPGQTEYLYPYHYAFGYSKVVSITADL